MEPRGSSVRNGDKAADERGGGNYPKCRLGRPRTRTWAFIAGGVALRAIRPREVQHKQEDVYAEEILRLGGSRRVFSLGRLSQHCGPADNPPAPFGSRWRRSRRAGSVRRPIRLRGAQEQHAWRDIAPATPPPARKVPAESVLIPVLEIILTSNTSWRRRRINQIAKEGLLVK